MAEEKDDLAALAGGGTNAGFKAEMRSLQFLLSASKLNPLAEEFVPPSLSLAAAGARPAATATASPRGSRIAQACSWIGDAPRRGSNNRTNKAQRDDVIRRTIYVSDIDYQVTEEQLAALFIGCGQVVDCRMCGDPKSVLRFAFIEFTDEDGARAALSFSGTVLGYYPVKIFPSKTAIAPVNPSYLPKSDYEREMCARTVYCTNIDKKVTEEDLKAFFELMCGKVFRLRLLGDDCHATYIAFVEFVLADSATAALNCSGALLGSLPIRISPSKTPVRPLSAVFRQLKL